MSLAELLELDVRYFMIVIMVMGSAFGAFVLWRLKKLDDDLKDSISKLDDGLKDIISNQGESNEQFWTAIKENTRLYNQVDKLEGMNSLAIRFISDPNAPIETMRQSADGKGDHAINRDV